MAGGPQASDKVSSYRVCAASMWARTTFMGAVDTLRTTARGSGATRGNDVDDAECECGLWSAPGAPGGGATKRFWPLRKGGQSTLRRRSARSSSSRSRAARAARPI